MASVTIPPMTAPPAHEELVRLFNLYRICELNKRYYGRRSEHFEWKIRAVEMSAGLCCAVALFLLVSFESGMARWWGATLAGVALVATALPPLAGWSKRATELCNLHAIYLEVLAQIDSVIVEIRRDGLTSGALSASKLVHEAYRRAQSKDEKELDESLIEAEQKKVNDALPADYLYSHF